VYNFAKTTSVPPKIFVIFISLLICTSFAIGKTDAGCSVSLDNSDSKGIEITVQIQNLDINPLIDGSRYKITIPGESPGGAPGYPDLPHISRLIVIPPTVGIELEWSGCQPRTISSHTPEQVATKAQSSDYEWTRSTTLRTTTELWPSQVVEVDDPVIMRGIRMVNVTVNPVQFDPISGNLIVHDRIQVKLNYTADNAINSVLNPERLRPSSSTIKLARSLVLNPQDIRRDEPELRGTYLYVIPEYVQGDTISVADVIQPLVNWRLRQGYPTEVITIEEDASNVDVKRALLDAYFEWDIPPEIITLVGDADVQPHSDFMIPTWDVGRVYMWETDYKYALLEGDDLLPEVAIGRLSARNIGELEDLVNKVLSYETTPYMERTEWYRRAALLANDQRTGYSSIYVQRWLRKMLLEVGFTEVDTMYFTHEIVRNADHQFIVDNFTEGINVFNYRGWGQFSGAWRINDARNLRNVGMWPIVVMPTCNSNDFVVDPNLGSTGYGEEFFWSDGGAIGAVGSSGFTHTNYNNVFDGGVLNGFFRDENWRLGYAVNQGKLELYRHFGMYNDQADPQVRELLIWEAHCYQFNLIGDPGTSLWTAIPQAIEVNHAETLLPGENRLIVTVRDADENALLDITVTLVRENEIIINDRTNVDGSVDFTFTPGELEIGTYQLTASKHNMIPYLGEVEVLETDHFLGFTSLLIDDDQAGRSNGNGDHLPNPGERLELRTYVRNFGNEAVQGEVDFSLELFDGDAEIVVGEEHINEAPSLNDSAVVTFVVDIGQENWDLRQIAFQLNTIRGDDEWNSVIAFNAATPNLEYPDDGQEHHVFNPSPFSTGDTAWVDVTLCNIGSSPSERMNATLVSNREVIVVFNEHAVFDPIDPENEETATARFRIYAHTLTVPGTPVEMEIHLESEAGFRDTTRFSFVVGTPQSNTPFGPDAYGYVCFDDTDDAWEDNRPVYEWVEIDSTLRGPGHYTGIEDQGNEQDWSVLIDLPFPFQYYGRPYGLEDGPEELKKITICSNGWFAFGDESKLADFQNRRIPPALGPRAQVCVFWDDLVNYVDDQRNQIGGIFYWYDEENHRFIIEWSRMRRYVGTAEGHMVEGSLNTFQAILYDPQHLPTYTGDGEIVFQYQTVNDDPDVDPLEFDTPYATVGIVNLNGTDGMEYVFWNEYTPGAARLEDHRAIKFSTVLVIAVGYAMGTVFDIDNGNPIPNAEIRASHGSFGLTDENGLFSMDNVLIGEDYFFTAWAAGYNEQTLGPFDIAEGDTIELFFELTHPGFVLSKDSIDVRLQPGIENTQEITLSNDGNGPLEFRSYFDYYGVEEEQHWQRLADIDVSALTGNENIQGVVFREDQMWVTGSRYRGDEGWISSRFYRFDREGNYVDHIDQPGWRSRYGFRGITTDGELLYGGDRDWILGVDMEGHIVDSLPSPIETIAALAYDPDGFFFVANGRYDPLFKIDRDGNILGTWRLEPNIQGLGFFKDDPDGYPLYIVSRDKPNPTMQIPFALVSKFNPETGALRTITVLEGDLRDEVCGMEIVSGYDPTKWVMLAVLSNPEGDRISVYDMGPNTDWVQYEPRLGIIEAGESTTISMNINSAGLDEGDYQLLLRFIHNAAGLEAEIPVILHVDSLSNIDDEIVIPLEFALGQNYPNPFNAVTGIPYSLPVSGLTKLAVFDISGREVATLIDGYVEAGRHYIAFDAVDFASGVYIVHLEACGYSARIKMVLIK